MSDTPRTDAELRDWMAGTRQSTSITAPFARTLERELAAARSEIDRLRGLAEYAATDALGQEGVKIMRESLSAARSELATAREHEAAALSGQRQLLAKYDGALRQLEEARESLREAILREIVWSAHCHCSLTDMSMDEYTAMLSKWRKAAGMDATAGEVKA